MLMDDASRQFIAEELHWCEATASKIASLLTLIDESLPTVQEVDEIRVVAMAGYLSTLYRNIEKILEAVAKGSGVAIPSGPAWHAELLRMFSEPPSTGLPLLVASEFSARLNALRGFRSVFLNVYAVRIQWGKLESHARDAAEIVHLFSSAVHAFLSAP
jgi:hypothetical protein